MKKTLVLALAAAAMPVTAIAQTTTTTQAPTTRDRLGQLLGTLLGGVSNTGGTLESQWAMGRTPLANQRAEFEARVDTDTRSGRLTVATATRLKADYASLVALEARYGADGRFTTSERADLSDRYGAITQVLAEGAYAAAPVTTPVVRADVSEGRAAFNTRVDAAVAARKLSRTAGTQLKADYARLITVEAGYLRDGVLSDTERADLDARLDALDLRVGDVAYNPGALTAKARLDAIARAIPSAKLTLAARNQLLVEHGDLAKLDAAYARTEPTADERAYLARRLANLEVRAQLTR